MDICDTTSDSGSKEHRSGTPKLQSVEGASSLAWAISSDARWLARGDAGGTVEVWDIKSQPPRLHETRSFAKQPVSRLLFRGQDALLAVVTEDQLSLWNVQENADPVSLEPKLQATSVAFDREGLYMAAGDANGLVQVWDLRVPDAEPKKWRLPKTTIKALTFMPNDDDSWAWLAAETPGGWADGRWARCRDRAGDLLLGGSLSAGDAQGVRPPRPVSQHVEIGLGAIAALIFVKNWGLHIEIFPVMVVLGPLMVLQYAYWRRRRGVERTTWQYLQVEPLRH